MGLPRLGQALPGVLAMLGVPAAAAAAGKGFVVHHPYLAVALTVVYELLLGAVTLLGRASSKPLQRRLDQLGDAFDAALSRQAPRYRRRYRAYVRASLRRIDSKGLATIGPFTPELGEVYVDVGMAPRAPGEIPTGALAEDLTQPAERRSLSEFLDRGRPAVLAVLGGPGSGKTTVLRHIAYRAAADRRRRRRGTPVFLALRDHASVIVNDPSLALPKLLRTVMPDREVTEPAGWWAGKLREGDCLILFDGLDEIARAEDRAAVSAWIEQQISVYPRNDYVVTSRPLGYEKARINGADVLWVRPFSDEQVTQFLRNWYLATERRATGSTGPDVALTAEQNATDLLERLAAAPALYELTVNPLLLTMIANVHRYRGALPGSRAELYGEICQVMLYRRQEAKKQQSAVDIPGPDKETLLARLAYTMMTRRVRDLPRDQLLAVLRPHLDRLPGSVTGEDFINDVANNGLLVEREHHLYAFAHHTFGEYLAARHIGTVSGAQVQVLAKNVDDAWWRETTLLHLALPGGDADPIVRACLRAGDHTALALAFAAAAGRPLAPDLRQRLDDTHMLAFRPDADPTHRRLIAAVLATETLSQWVTTPAGTHVCPQPITTHLYTLFVRDTGSPAPDGPLKAPPAPAQMVTGVWAGDALAFTAWINALALGPGIYRLPTREEAHCAFRRAAGAQPRGVWTMEEPSRRPTLWNPDDRRPAHLVGGADLARAVLTDLQTTDVLLQLAWTGIRSLAVSLTRHFARERVDALSREGSVALSHGRPDDYTIAIVRDLVRLLGRTDNLFVEDVRDLTRALTPEMDRVHDLAPDLALDLAGVLRVAHSRSSHHDHDHDLDHALGLDLHPGDDDAESMSDPSVSAMGQALAKALSTTTPSPGPNEGRRTPRPGEDFTHAFMEAVSVPAKAQFVIDLETLAGMAGEACAHLAAGEVPGVSQSIRTVAQRLAEAVAPVLERRFTPTQVGWAELRLPALALAGEAFSGGRPEIGDSFRRLAAGVTLMQQRAGDPSQREIILLARA